MRYEAQGKGETWNNAMKHFHCKKRLFLAGKPEVYSPDPNMLGILP